MDEKDQEIAALKAKLALATGEAPLQEPLPAREDGPPRWLVVSVVVVFGAIALFMWLAHEGAKMNDIPMDQRIAENCEREYGARGEEAVNACRIQLSIETIGNAERDRLDRARSGL